MPRIVLESYQRGSSKFNFYQLVQYIHKQFNYCIYLTDYSLDDDKNQTMSRESLRLMGKSKTFGAGGRSAAKINTPFVVICTCPASPTHKLDENLSRYFFL